MALHLPFLPAEHTSPLVLPRSLPPSHSRTLLFSPPTPLHLRLRAPRPRVVRASASKASAESPAATKDAASPDDLENIAQIKRVLELLRKNRDMMFEEIRLTIMIEDPREAERKRLLGIDDDDVTRDDLVAALEDVNEGKLPRNRVALKLLAEEMLQWPNLEVEAPKSKPSTSPYAKVTDTGVDPRAAAKRLNIDWDAAAETEPGEESSEPEVPPVVGYGALYLVTALPVIIGISVVLILFYNSLQ